MRRGSAMIIGPEGTPYAHCPLVFSVEFPDDYPFSSPKVNFVTSDGYTRFHPNLYIDGKVCLSILGTWSGPKWAAVMTISTVLTSIQSLLEPNPIVNEPGWEKYGIDNPKAKDYADFVQHGLITYTIRGLNKWKNGNILPEWSIFEDVINERGDELIAKLGTIIQNKSAHDEISYSIIYNMRGTTIWKKLEETWRHSCGKQ